MSNASRETSFRVSQLIARAAMLLDDGRFDEWIHLFDENASYSITTRENLAQGNPIGILSCDDARMLRDRVAALRDANIYEPHHYNHLNSIPVLVDQAADQQWRTNFLVHRIMERGETMLFASGYYLDTFTAGSQPLQFMTRKVVLDSSAIDTLLVIPL